MAQVKAVCISKQKGEQKHQVKEILLQEDYGIAGDAHSGTSGHRQVSLLAAESVEKLQKNIDMELKPGAFAENILTEGIRLYTLSVGSRLQIGSCIGEISQIGKECHHGCAIRQLAGDCVMPREGIFITVIKGGTVKPGDKIQVQASSC